MTLYDLRSLHDPVVITILTTPQDPARPLHDPCTIPADPARSLGLWRPYGARAPCEHDAICATPLRATELKPRHAPSPCVGGVAKGRAICTVRSGEGIRPHTLVHGHVARAHRAHREPIRPLPRCREPTVSHPPSLAACPAIRPHHRDGARRVREGREGQRRCPQ